MVPRLLCATTSTTRAVERRIRRKMTRSQSTSRSAVRGLVPISQCGRSRKRRSSNTAIGRAMLRFRSIRSLQKFAAVHASVSNDFNQERSLSSRHLFNLIRTAALSGWRGLCAGYRTTSLSKLRLVRISLPAPSCLFLMVAAGTACLYAAHPCPAPRNASRRYRRFPLQPAADPGGP